MSDTKGTKDETHTQDKPTGPYRIVEKNTRTGFEQKTHSPSGSDQSKSHMGPSWGTSCFRSITRIYAGCGGVGA